MSKWSPKDKMAKMRRQAIIPGILAYARLGISQMVQASSSRDKQKHYSKTYSMASVYAEKFYGEKIIVLGQL